MEVTLNNCCVLQLFNVLLLLPFLPDLKIDSIAREILLIIALLMNNNCVHLNLTPNRILFIECSQLDSIPFLFRHFFLCFLL